MGATILSFLFAWLPGNNVKLLTWLSCSGRLDQPWTFLTYPFAIDGNGFGILTLILTWLWMYWICSAIEATDRALNLLLYFFLYTMLGAIFVSLVGRIMNVPNVITGTMLPISALTCLWCSRNQSAEIRLMMMIPVNGRVMAIISGVLVLLMYGTINPILGLFAVVPCAIGWLQGSRRAFATTKKQVNLGRGMKSSNPQEFEEYMLKVRKKEKEREEKERLRQLLEGKGPGNTES